MIKDFCKKYEQRPLSFEEIQIIKEYEKKDRIDYENTLISLQILLFRLNKENRNLLIAMAIGDGCVQSNKQLKISHSWKQYAYLKYKQLNRIYILHSNPNTAFKVEEYYIHLKKTIEKDHVRVIPSLETIITILKENNTHITSNSQK